MPTPVSRDGEFFHNYTPLMELVPRQDNLLEQLGLFDKIYNQGTLIEVERVESQTDKMYAVARGADRQFAGTDLSKTETFRVPLFTLDQVITPKDLQDLVAYNTPSAPQTVQDRVSRLVARIQRGHYDVHKRSMFTCLTSGVQYAKDKDGNDMAGYVKNFATTFGVGALVTTANVDLTAAATDPVMVIEKSARAHINKYIGNNAQSIQVIGIVGSGWFNGFTKHPLVKEAYSQYSSSQEPLRDRLGGDNYRRTFTHQGITYIEEPDVSVVARDKGYILPLGVDDMFQLHYAPSDTIADANEIAQEAYLWVEEFRRKVVAESEVAVTAICTRPELIVASTATLPAWA